MSRSAINTADSMQLHAFFLAWCKFQVGIDIIGPLPVTENGKKYNQRLR